jgi:hypothetical protein
MHQLQRHREILHDLRQEFGRSRAALTVANERSQLLSSVREDIREHRCAASRASEALLRERNAIGASGRAADEVLEAAQATRDALNAQRGGFSSIGGKLRSIAALSPQINALMGMISRRQKRDRIVLGVVVGLCTGLGAHCTRRVLTLRSSTSLPLLLVRPHTRAACAPAACARPRAPASPTISGCRARIVCTVLVYGFG